MKRIKINKCLCLLFVVVFSILYLTSLTVFAAHIDGGTEVTARIETVTSNEETKHPATDNSSSVFQDDSDVTTGDAVSGCVIVALFTLVISSFVIFLCINNKSVDIKNELN